MDSVKPDMSTFHVRNHGQSLSTGDVESVKVALTVLKGSNRGSYPSPSQPLKNEHLAIINLAIAQHEDTSLAARARRCFSIFCNIITGKGAHSNEHKIVSAFIKSQQGNILSAIRETKIPKLGIEDYVGEKFDRDVLESQIYHAIESSILTKLEASGVAKTTVDSVEEGEVGVEYTSDSLENTVREFVNEGSLFQGPTEQRAKAAEMMLKDYFNRTPSLSTEKKIMLVISTVLRLDLHNPQYKGGVALAAEPILQSLGVLDFNKLPSGGNESFSKICRDVQYRHETTATEIRSIFESTKPEPKPVDFHEEL